MSTATATTDHHRTAPTDATHDAGYSAIGKPVGESLLVVEPLLRAAGAPIPSGLSTIAVADAGSFVVRYRDIDAQSAVGPSGAAGAGTALVVSGAITRVPWAGTADSVIVLAETPGGPVVFAAPADVRVLDTETDLAGNPLSTLVFEDTEITAPTSVRREVADDVPLRLAAVHALLIAGAAQRCAELTVEHTSTRKQFGHTLDHFQAVKQNEALLLEEVALVRAVVELATWHLNSAVSQPLSASARTAVTAAAVQAGASAGEIARLAHQLHGAVGFTELSDLHRHTTRLWASRDAIGGEWSARLGASAISAGVQGVWPLVTKTTEDKGH